MKKTAPQEAEAADLRDVDAAALRRFVGDVLTGKRSKRVNSQLKTFTVRIQYDLHDQVRLGILCEKANMSAGPYLVQHLKMAMWRLFDKMTEADTKEFRSRMDKIIADMQQAKAVNT